MYRRPPSEQQRSYLSPYLPAFCPSLILPSRRSRPKPRCRHRHGRPLFSVLQQRRLSSTTRKFPSPPTTITPSILRNRNPIIRKTAAAPLPLPSTLPFNSCIPSHTTTLDTHLTSSSITARSRPRGRRGATTSRY